MTVVTPNDINENKPAQTQPEVEETNTTETNTTETSTPVATTPAPSQTSTTPAANGNAVVSEAYKHIENHMFGEQKDLVHLTVQDLHLMYSVKRQEKKLVDGLSHKKVLEHKFR